MNADLAALLSATAFLPEDVKAEAVVLSSVSSHRKMLPAASAAE
jgi:hypothetical protein